VSVFFDFGDGRSDVAIVPWDPTHDSAWNATEVAAQDLGYELNVTWFSFGVQVNAIDGALGGWPSWWWHLMTWNFTARRWEQSALGASDLEVSAGTQLLWYRQVDHPQSFETPAPALSPPFPFPWTTFRGASGNPGSRNTGEESREWSGGPQNQAELKWSYDTGQWEADGTPLVLGGRLYVSTENGLVALAVEDGSVVWARPDIRGMSTPAYFNGSLLVGGMDGSFHAVNLATGAEIWNFTGETGWSISSSPMIIKGVGVVGVFNTSGGDGAVLGFDLFARKLSWRHNVTSVHLSSAASNGEFVYIGITGKYGQSQDRWDPPFGLLSLTLEGTKRWFFPTDGPVASSPMLLGERVYFTSRGKSLYALTVNGALAWRAEIGYSTSSPATDGEKIYVGSGSLDGQGKVRAFDQKGKEIWTRITSGGVQSSPVVDGERVYVATNTAKGSVIALNATTGKLVWSVTPTPEQYILGSPTIWDGHLFIATDSGFVFAYVEKEEKHEDEPSLSLGAWIALVAVVALGLIMSTYLLIKRKGRPPR